MAYYNFENWSNFQRIQLAEPCMLSFGYWPFQGVIERRQPLVACCNRTMKRARLCGRIRRTRYSQAEARRMAVSMTSLRYRWRARRCVLAGPTEESV